MDVAESILDSIDEELSFDDDVEMMEVEEGEVVDAHTTGFGETHTTHIDDEQANMNSHCANSNTKITANNMTKKRRNKKKKKNKKNKMMPPCSDAINIDKFVLGVCKRLREHKSYLVYTAVGVLGVSALKDLLREVDAVQACGGQKTALGDRHRSGGGILWNILKTRDPNAYKEIMKKGRDFEKQFRRPSSSALPPGASGSTSEPIARILDDVQPKLPAEEQSVQTLGEKRSSVHNRIRVPVSYDDLPAEPQGDQSS